MIVSDKGKVKFLNGGDDVLRSCSQGTTIILLIYQVSTWDPLVSTYPFIHSPIRCHWITYQQALSDVYTEILKYLLKLQIMCFRVGIQNNTLMRASNLWNMISSLSSVLSIPILQCKPQILPFWFVPFFICCLFPRTEVWL